LQRPNPKALSDEELVRRCSGLREFLLWSLGCLGAFIVLLAMIAVALTIVGGGRWPVWLGTALFLVALLHQPAYRYRKELDYRSGRAPFPIYMEEAEAALAAGQADWIILFMRLPRYARPTHDRSAGSLGCLRLVLNNGPPATAQASFRAPGAKLPVYKQRDFPEARAKALLTFFASLDLAQLTDLRDQPLYRGSSVPCRIAVLRREPRTVVSATCYLNEFPHPTVLACQKLNEIVNELRGKRNGPAWRAG
jgi:hypothetical protein